LPVIPATARITARLLIFFFAAGFVDGLHLFLTFDLGFQLRINDFLFFLVGQRNPSIFSFFYFYSELDCLSVEITVHSIHAPLVILLYEICHFFHLHGMAFLDLPEYSLLTLVHDQELNPLCKVTWSDLNISF
jgi:hypothetical protein